VKIDTSPRDDRTAVAVTGEIDLATADAMGDAVREHLRAGPVLLDLSQVAFMDSSGVRALDALLRDVDAEGWDLLVVPTLTEAVEQVLELTAMRDQLPFDDPMGAA
jgi:anti-sigma B factor antagonist